MAKTRARATARRGKKTLVFERQLNLHVGRRRIHVIMDKVLIFRFLRSVHGRFWGLAAIIVLMVGFFICYMIRPDLFRADSAFSDFGTDLRTAPYFAGAVFFAAYGLWRWRNYLKRTWRRSMPVTGFLTLTIFGLYTVALMPIAWRPWPYRIHMAGMILAGVSMILTVVFDGLLTKTKQKGHVNFWRFLRLVSFLLIVCGGWLTLVSSEPIGLKNAALLGEFMMFAGYGLWVSFKTYQGEGARSALSRLLRGFVLVD